MKPAEAKGYVIARVDNLLRYLREHPGVILVPYQARRDYFYGISYIGIGQMPEPIPAARDEKLGLRELEVKANLPRGVAGHGSCMRCGRTLTDPKSVQAGIGPECIKKGPKAR